MARLGGGGIIAMGLAAAMLSQTAFSGQLTEFEDAVAKPNVSSSSNSDSDDVASGGFVVEIVIGFCRGVYQGVKFIAYSWWATPEEENPRYGESFAEDASTAGDPGYVEHELGETDELTHKSGTMGLPYARFDYRWQYLDSDTSAHDFLLETGYKYLAFVGRTTKYESTAGEHLDIEQYYGMLRFGGSDEFFFPGSFQIGLGLGEYSIKGQQNQSGLGLTLPVTFCPYDWIGVEFRPAWSSMNQRTIGDYDISVSSGYRYFHFRTGYRWIWVQGEGHWLNGPYAGLSVMF